MKSKMTNFVVLICLLSMGGMVFGQIAPIDFEAGGYGADWTWTVFENGTNPPVAIIANPDATGSNTSATVAEFTALDAGMDWAGCENLDIGEFTFDATNSTVTIAVYKTVLSDFRLKFEGASAPVEINVANTVTSAWEELTYDFSGQIGNTYNKLVIFPDFAPRDQDNIIYFDNITFSEQIISEDPVPTVAAPTPTIPEAEVISIYSDAYTDIAGTDFYPGWGQATVVTEVQIDGNNTLLYTGLNYQGIVLGSPQDVSTMGYLHVDFWSTNSTALSLFLISQTTGERSFAFTITNDEWVSVDIPLTAFTDQGMTIADIHQLKYDGNGDIYLDNMFFHGDAPAEDPVPTVAAPTPTVPEAEVVSIYSDAYTDVAGTDFNPGWGQATVFSEVQVDGNNTLLYAGLNYQGTVFAGPVDVSTFGYFHVDFWSTNSTALGLSLISQTTGERLYNFTVTNNEWVSVDVPLSHFADLGLNLADIHQLKFEGNGDVYLDNYFFHGDAPEEDLVPTVAAPAPTVPEVDVVSVYSDAYTDIAGTNFNPGWGQTTVITEVQIDGNNTLLYSGLDYQGIELGSPQDVSAMGYLHVDFWSANSTALEVSLISQTTGERTYACTVINDEWVSVDIPLTAYTDQGMTLGDVFQLKYVGNGDVYLDNMYFYAEEEVVTGPNAPIDFEAEGFGADWGWSTFENGANDPPAIIANPHAEGINTSATVAEFTALVAGQPWAGFESTHGADIGTFNLDATNSTIKIMVYKTVISDVGIKLAKPDGWALPEVKVANTVVNEWEELTFDFSTHHQEGYDQIVVFPDFNLDGRTQDNLVYLDNITFSPQMLPTEPTVAAPVPTQDEADVVSLFSNAYTNVTVDTWSAEWDAADVADAQVVGDDVKLYTNLTFAGVEFTSAPVDASEMTHFHLDLWTPDPTAAPAVFKVKLVDFGADGAFGGGDDTEHELEFTDPPLMTGSWVSIDVPMADFAGLSEQAHLAQMIITSDPNTVYVDNVYFYAEEVVLPGPHAPVDFEVGGHGADWTWTVEENATNPALEVIANPVSGGINTSATVGRFTALQAGQPWALFYTDDIGEFTFDTTNALVKIMVHKPIVSNFAIKLEGASPPIEIQIPNTVTNDWEELSFNFADQIGNSYNRIVIIPDFDMGGRTQDNIIHIDNITFSSSQEEPLPGLFFSEYSEGSEGSNKYVEIYNPTGVDVDLSSYSVQGTNNGTAWGDGGDRDTTLSGILAAGDVFIIAPDQANADILALANMILEYESPVHYNGDDGIALLKDGLIIDAIGVENVDPGDGWDVAGVAEATQDHTLIRKNEVMFGNIGNWEMSAGTDSLDSQWLVADPATNDYTPPTLGWHITPPPAVPVVAAPIPDVNADQVLSIFSGAYTDLAETNFNPDWGQSTVVSNEEVAGDNTLKYVDLNYQGTILGGAEGVDQDVTGYEYIHVDFWTPNATALNFFLISRTTGEQVFALPVATEEWVSVDIPLSHFTDLGLGLSDIFQFKVDGGDGSTIVYFDNWYFYTTVVSVEDLAMLPEESVLEQNFPNPFNPSTTLRYGIPEESAVSMIIYDIRGNVVRTMQSGSKPAGWYELEWNGLDNAGIPVSTGLYLTRLQVGTYTQTIKMLYLK